jgi:hypothetical protein
VTTALNFTPVQQGGGNNEGTDKIYLGWHALTTHLRYQRGTGTVVPDSDDLATLTDIAAANTRITNISLITGPVGPIGAPSTVTGPKGPTGWTGPPGPGGPAGAAGNVGYVDQKIVAYSSFPSISTGGYVIFPDNIYIQWWKDFVNVTSGNSTIGGGSYTSKTSLMPDTIGTLMCVYAVWDGNTPSQYFALCADIIYGNQVNITVNAASNAYIGGLPNGPLGVALLAIGYR